MGQQSLDLDLLPEITGGVSSSFLHSSMCGVLGSTQIWGHAYACRDMTNTRRRKLGLGLVL